MCASGEQPANVHMEIKLRAVRDHLEDVRANVPLVAPEAETGLLAMP
jgi:hypothetical protein